MGTVTSALFAQGVICPPDQHLSRETDIGLARALGDIDVKRFFTPIAAHPDIGDARIRADQVAVIGATWRTDHSHDAVRAAISILSTRTPPPFGGDGHFASQTVALAVL